MKNLSNQSLSNSNIEPANPDVTFTPAPVHGAPPQPTGGALASPEAPANGIVGTQQQQDNKVSSISMSPIEWHENLHAALPLNWIVSIARDRKPTLVVHLPSDGFAVQLN